MRKKIFGRQLSRNTNSRKALFRSLTRELLLKGSIETTLAKAKSIQGDIDGVLVKVRSNSVTARRALLSQFGNDRELVEHAFKTYFEAAHARTSGYTRVTKLAPRKGDNSKRARIEVILVKDQTSELATESK